MTAEDVRADLAQLAAGASGPHARRRDRRVQFHRNRRAGRRQRGDGLRTGAGRSGYKTDRPRRRLKVAKRRRLHHEAGMTGISIFGASGRMGQAIAQAIEDRDDVQIAEHRPDVFVDFSVPEAVQEHVAAAVAAGTPILIGTTGAHRRASPADRRGRGEDRRPPDGQHLARRQSARPSGPRGGGAARHRLGHRDRRDAPSPQGRRAVGHGADARHGGGRRAAASTSTRSATAAATAHRRARARPHRLRLAARRLGRRRSPGHLRRRGRAARARPPRREPRDLRPWRGRGRAVARRQARRPLHDGGRVGTKAPSGKGRAGPAAPPRPVRRDHARHGRDHRRRHLRQSGRGRPARLARPR